MDSAIWEKTTPIDFGRRSFEISPLCLENFKKAFSLQNIEKPYPPTIMARALTSTFDILNEIKVDWLSLFHISQSFEYFQDFDLPGRFECQCQLTRLRKRAGQAWLQFETQIFLPQSDDIVMTLQSMIMVKADE